MREREAIPVSVMTETRMPRLDLLQPCEPLSDVSSDSAPSSRDGEGSDAMGTAIVGTADRLGYTLAVPTVTRPSLPPPPPCQPAATTPAPAHKSKSLKKSKKHKERDRESGRRKDRNRVKERDTEAKDEDSRRRDQRRDPGEGTTVQLPFLEILYTGMV